MATAWDSALFSQHSLVPLPHLAPSLRRRLPTSALWDGSRSSCWMDRHQVIAHGCALVAIQGSWATGRISQALTYLVFNLSRILANLATLITAIWPNLSTKLATPVAYSSI